MQYYINHEQCKMGQRSSPLTRRKCQSWVECQTEEQAELPTSNWLKSEEKTLDLSFAKGMFLIFVQLGSKYFSICKIQKIHAIKQACADIWSRYLDRQQIVKEIKLFFYVEEIVWHILPFDHSQYLLSHKEHNQTVEAKTVS